MADPYKTLGVAKDASADDIRKAYRKLAKENHPDLNPGNAAAEARFKEISAAYDILGDEAKRKRFDAGEIDEQGAERPERRYYREYAEAEPGARYTQRAGPEDFADMGGIFEDLFRTQAGAGGRGRARSGGAEGLDIPGGDLRYALSVDLRDAVLGASRTVTMPDGRTLTIKIPPGVRDGQSLRLKGQGQAGFGKGEPGDALVEITVLPDPAFTRDGDDIRSVLPITLSEALNGGTVRAETLTGAVDLKVPRGATTGTVLRLRGKGVPARKNKSAADQFVELRVAMPPGADDALASFVADWEKQHPYDPRAKRGQS